MWLVKEMLSVFIWILTILGFVSLIAHLLGVGGISWKPALVAIVGSFLLCWGYFSVRYADSKFSK